MRRTSAAEALEVGSVNQGFEVFVTFVNARVAVQVKGVLNFV